MKENAHISNKDNLKLSVSHKPILPRSPWEDNEKAWLQQIIKTKKALEKAEKKALGQIEPISIFHKHKANLHLKSLVEEVRSVF